MRPWSDTDMFCLMIWMCNSSATLRKWWRHWQEVNFSYNLCLSPLMFSKQRGASDTKLMRNGAEHHLQGNFKPKCNFLAIVSVHNFKHAVLSLQLCCTSVCPVACFKSINKFWGWTNPLKPFVAFCTKNSVFCPHTLLMCCSGLRTNSDYFCVQR